MVLKEYLLDRNSSSSNSTTGTSAVAARTVMIASVSSAAAQATKSLNTIKYAALVADAFAQHN